MANRLPATDARRVSPAFLLYGRCRFKSMCFLLLRGFSALFRLFWLGKFPPSTKPAPLSPGLAAGTGQHRPSRAPWCAFPHPLQNRVPRVQVLLPLPQNRRKHWVFAGFLFACVAWLCGSLWFKLWLFPSGFTRSQPFSSPLAPKTHPVSPFSG